jgi:hypothetical protein
LRYCDKGFGVLKSYERFVVTGYLRVLGVPDLGVNLRKFRSKRKVEIQRSKEAAGICWRRKMVVELSGWI